MLLSLEPLPGIIDAESSNQGLSLRTQRAVLEPPAWRRPACAAWARPKLVATTKTSRNLVALDISHGFPRVRLACGEGTGTCAACPRTTRRAAAATEEAHNLAPLGV